MPQWTYKITINNCLDRALELITSNVPWGIEFYFSMRDKINTTGEPHYGSFSFSVDVPYWKHANKSSFECTDILTQSGFQKIPDGNHDFSTTVNISTSLCENFLPLESLVKENDVKSNYSTIYDWDFIQKLETVEPDEKTINDFIPENNSFSKRKTVNRTEKISVPKSLWKQIIDRKYCRKSVL